MKSRNDKLTTYSQHFQRLVHYTTSIVGSHAVAEDVVQEAWIRFGQGQDIEHPERYLYRIVHNLALDVQRRRQVEQRCLLASQPLEQTALASIEEIVYGEQALQRVNTALAELPERTRRVFLAYRSGKYTMQQIADSMEISVGLVHKLIRDAMTHCASVLE